MKTITDDLKIFKLLEEIDLISFDPSKSAVFEFVYDNCWCLLLFAASGPAKGCKLFLLENQNQIIEAEKILLPELLLLSEDYGYDILKNEALTIVEKLISQKNNDRLFFDAH